MHKLIYSYKQGELLVAVFSEKAKGHLIISYKEIDLFRCDYDESGLPENYRKGKEALFENAVNIILRAGIAHNYEFINSISK